MFLYSFDLGCLRSTGMVFTIRNKMQFRFVRFNISVTANVNIGMKEFHWQSLSSIFEKCNIMINLEKKVVSQSVYIITFGHGLSHVSALR